jgi:hypothetical protein
MDWCFGTVLVLLVVAAVDLGPDPRAAQDGPEQILKQLKIHDRGGFRNFAKSKNERWMKELQSWD